MPIQSDNPPELITLEQWKGLNQQAKQGSIDDQEEFWNENLFRMDNGTLRACWGPSAPIYTCPSGTSILRIFFGYYGRGTPGYSAPGPGIPGAMGWMFLSDGTIDEVDLNLHTTTGLRAAAQAWHPAGTPSQTVGIWVPEPPQYWASAKVWRPQFVGNPINTGQQGGVLFGSPYGLFAWDGTTLSGPGDPAPDWLTDKQETNPNPGPGTGPPTTWNPSDKTPQVTLSNTNLTATFTGVDQGVRAVDSLNFGRFYFEETLTTLSGDGAVGVATATADLTKLITPWDDTGLAVVLSSGAIVSGGTITGSSIGQRSNGDIVGIAVDMYAQLIWFRAPVTVSTTAAAATAAGSTLLTLASTTGIVVGMLIAGVNNPASILPGTEVSAVSPTTVNMNNVAQTEITSGDQLQFQSLTGSWNGSATADPAAGTGGVSIAALGPANTPLFPVAGSASNGAVITANFSTSPFLGTIPSNFAGGWFSSPPPPTMPVGLPGIYTMEVYQSRLWVAGKDVISFSAPSNGADFSTTNGGGSFGYFGDKLVYTYQYLRAISGYLYVFGDSSTDLISNIQLSGQGTPESPYTTNFNYENVDPQIGQRFPRPVGAVGRNSILFNMNGLYQFQGGDAQPVGEKTINIWNTLDTSLYLPTFADLCHHGFRLLLVNGRFTDIFGVTRNLLLMWHPERGKEFWSVASQGIELTNIGTYEQDSCPQAWGTDGANLYRLFAQPDPTLIKRLVTKRLRGKELAQLTVKNWTRVYVELDDNDGSGVSITGTLTTGDGGVPGGVQSVDFNLLGGEIHKILPSRVESAGIWGALDLISYSPDYSIERIHLAAHLQTLFGA